MKLSVSSLRVDYGKSSYVEFDSDGDLYEEETGDLSPSEIVTLYSEAIKLAKEVGLKPTVVDSDEKARVGSLTLEDGNGSSITINEDENCEENDVSNLSVSELLEITSAALKYKEKYFPKKKPVAKK